MSWKDPKSPWAKRAKRYQWLNTAYWIACGVFAIGFGIAAYLAMPPLFVPIDDPLDWLFLLPLAGLLWCAIFTLMLFRSARKYKRLIRDVPALDGAVCPWCWRAMTNAEHEAPAGAAARLCCKRCKCEHPLEELQQYWVWMVLHMRTAGHWHVEHHPRRDTWFGRWRRSLFKEKAWYAKVATGSILPAIYIAGMWWFMGASSLPHIVALLIFFIAFAVFPSGMFWRQGSTRHCVQCDYQVIPTPNVQQQRCPECGMDWSQPGSLISGKRPARSPSHNIRIATGVALLFVAFAAFMTAPLGLTSRIASTGLLMNQVTTGTGFLYTEWNVLAARNLTDEQRLDLARGLLQRRDSRSTLENDANQWFLDQIAADSLPADIVDEYLTGIIKARLLAPETAVVGEEISVGIENINRYQPPLAATTAPAIFFGGFLIGDDADACCRAEKVMSIISFGTRIVSYGMFNMPREQGAMVTITPDKPGPLHIRARYWIAGIPSGPGSMIQEIDWNEDGTPNFPPGTTWSYERVLEHTIEITEPQP